MKQRPIYLELALSESQGYTRAVEELKKLKLTKK